MTTPDLQERHDPADPGDMNETEGSQPTGELASILRNITILIAEADRRQEEALRELHLKLESLGHEARSVRANVPEEYLPAFEQIEDGLTEIANQIVRSENERTTARGAGPVEAEPSPIASSHETDEPAVTQQPMEEALSDYAPPVATVAFEDAPAPLRSTVGATPSLRGSHLPAGVDPFDLVDSTRPGDPEHPWDDASAEALTKVYESLAQVRRGHEDPDADEELSHAASNVAQFVTPRKPVDQVEAPASPASQGPVFDIGRDWLEARFAEIAARVEQSLKELRSESPASSLDTRFEQFENKFGQVMESVATRSDLDNLREFETHLDELAQHVEQAQLQLQRLDTIEAQLNTVMEKLSDQRLSQIFEHHNPPVQIDAERIAHQAAEQVAQRLASIAPSIKASPEDARRLDELRDLLTSFMQERRHGEEQTAGMLDTMQQAMIRLLDRVDALEIATQHDAPAEHHYATAEDGPYSDYELPQEMPSSQPALKAQAEQPPQAPAAGAVGKSEKASLDPSLKIALDGQPKQPEIQASQARPAEVTRDQLIAEARRAMNAAAAKREAEAQAEAETGKSKPKANAKSESKREAGGALGGFSKSSRRIMVGACTLLLLSSAVLMLMPRKGTAPQPSTDAKAAQVNGAEKAPEAAQKTSAPQAAQAAAPAAPTAVAPAPNASEPEVQPAQPVAPTTPPAKTGAASPIPPAFLPKSIPETAIDDLANPVAPRDRFEVQEASNSKAVFPGITMSRTGNISPQEAAKARDRQQMAEASTRLGTAQSNNASRVVNASVSGQDAQAVQGGAGVSRSAPTEMPPLLIGPLSLRQAASKGDPSAEFEVAARFAEGKGVPQDFPQAMRWYQRSASQGFGPSQYRLGTLYERGLGVKADPARARIWYQRAAEQGHVKAMHNLAVLSASRESGAPDYATASRWFTAAAESGLGDSQYNLAVLYEGGLGVNKDLQQAYKWFSVAGRGGDREALRRLDALRSKMSASEIQAAEQLVSGFEVKPVDRLVNDALTAGEAWKNRAQAEGGQG